MKRAEAAERLARREKLVYVRHITGGGFLAKFPYDAEFGQSLYIIPSWKSVYKKDPECDNPKGIFQGFQIHYLDLPLLEALSHKKGYTVEYEDRDTLRKLKAEYLERRRWKTEKILDVPIPLGKRILDELQTIGSQFMFRCGQALNADGMGVGKTAETIGAILLNKADGRPYRTLVVCPTGAKGVWHREAGLVSNLKTMILSGNMNERYEQFSNVGDEEMFICSYGSFVEDWKEIAKVIKPDILIIDECHVLCEKNNEITQILIGGKNIKKTFMAVARPHSTYLITGTPLSNKLDDLYPLLKLMDPLIINWNGYRSRYCLMEEGERWVHKLDPATGKKKARPLKYYTVVGYQNEKELKGKLALHMIRRNKDVALPNLPKKTYLPVIELELSPEERIAYDELRSKFETHIRGKKITAKNTLSWMTRAGQICNSLELLPGIKAKKSTKLKWLMGVVAREAKKRKIVIFATSEKMVKIMARELKQYNPVVLTGSYTGDRQLLVDEFQDNDSARLFISTIKAGGVAITLTAASLCILYNRWWTPAANDQAVDRLHRRGQLLPVDVMMPRMRDSVEEHVDKVWAIDKMEMVDNMVGVEQALKDMSKAQMVGLL